jgi:hypothetical protein
MAIDRRCIATFAVVVVTGCRGARLPPFAVQRADASGEEYLDDEFNEALIMGGCKTRSGYIIGVAWQPRHDVAVFLLTVRVHGREASDTQVIFKEDTHFGSPAVERIPRPDRDGVYTVEWAIAPELDTQRMLIAIGDCCSQTTALVAATGALARGDMWRSPPGEEIVIQAPKRDLKCERAR